MKTYSEIVKRFHPDEGNSKKFHLIKSHMLHSIFKFISIHFFGQRLRYK